MVDIIQRKAGRLMPSGWKSLYLVKQRITLLLIVLIVSIQSLWWTGLWTGWWTTRPDSSQSVLLSPVFSRDKTATTTESVHPAARVVGRDQQISPSLLSPKHDSSPSFHLVFSTGCSTSQDWQSYAFFYHVLRSGQPGNVTRVASGCSADEQRRLKQDFEKSIKSMSDRFHLHFTPSFGKIEGEPVFVYFNKPFGLKHWLDYGLEYKKHEQHLRDTVFVLLDPDEFVVRPFRHNYSDDEQLWINAGEITHRAVSHGKPMAQRYEFGTVFSTKLNIDELLNSTTVPSALRTWTAEIIEQHYVVGPPYLATGQDFYNLVQQWAEFAVPVYFQTGKGSLSEMFAYSIAAAHLDLPHQLVPNFMVSNVECNAKEEGWSAVDLYVNEENVCGPLTGALKTTVPPVLHYCQSYFLGPYFFSKASVPEQFLSCEHPLFAVPNATAIHLYNTSIAYNNKYELQVYSLQDFRIRKRHTFMVCQMLRLLNEVAIHFKSQHCANSTSRGAVNLEESFLWKTEDKY